MWDWRQRRREFLWKWRGGSCGIGFWRELRRSEGLDGRRWGIMRTTSWSCFFCGLCAAQDRKAWAECGFAGVRLMRRGFGWFGHFWSGERRICGRMRRSAVWFFGKMRQIGAGMFCEIGFGMSCCLVWRGWICRQWRRMYCGPCGFWRTSINLWRRKVGSGCAGREDLANCRRRFSGKFCVWNCCVWALRRVFRGLSCCGIRKLGRLWKFAAAGDCGGMSGEDWRMRWRSRFRFWRQKRWLRWRVEKRFFLAVWSCVLRFKKLGTGKIF